MTYNTLITPQELLPKLDDPEWVIVDCRFSLEDTTAGQRAYRRQHVPGALYAHLDDDLSGPPTTDEGRHPLPPPQALVRLFSRLGVDAGKQVVGYDDSGGIIAARLWWMLRYMGHEEAAVLDGGWSAWQRAGLPVQSGVIEPSPATFEGTPRRQRLVTVEEVPDSGLLIDSRAPARYRGEEEPYDPVAGHIPGAVNYYYGDNLDARGNFLSPGRLRRQLSERMGDEEPQGVVYYCGSGVSACHNVLAHVHAGLPEGRLYVGSWSEWCADPERPVARS